MRITITRTDAGFQVRLHGNPGQFELALDALKQDIPRQGRKFDPEQRCWIIGRECLAELECWLDWMRCEVKAEIVYESYHRRAAQPASHPRHAAYATLHLLPTAPPELVKAAYRCLALMNHPDRGGDTEVMQQINSAYARLSAGRI